MTNTRRVSLPVFAIVNGKLVRTDERLFFVRVEPERRKVYVVKNDGRSKKGEQK